MTMQDLHQLLNTSVQDVYDISPPQGSPRFVVLNPAAPLSMAADDAVYFSAHRCRAEIGWTNPTDSILSDVTGILQRNEIPYSLEFSDYDFSDTLFGVSLNILLLGG